MWGRRLAGSQFDQVKRSMRQHFVSLISLVVVLVAAVLAACFVTSAPPGLEQSDSCVPLPASGNGSHPPYAYFGMSFNFEERALKAFPVGSCENALVLWMDKAGFDAEVIVSPATTFFADEPDETNRNRERYSQLKTSKLRGLFQKAIIGTSVFSVAWNVDENGRLTELFVDTEYFQFDMP